MWRKPKTSHNPSQHPFKNGRSCHVMNLIRESPSFLKRDLGRLITKKTPHLRGFFIFDTNGFFPLWKRGIEGDYTTESSKFGANQRFASSSVQPLRFA